MDNEVVMAKVAIKARTDNVRFDMDIAWKKENDMKLGVSLYIPNCFVFLIPILLIFSLKNDTELKIEIFF